MDIAILLGILLAAVVGAAVGWWLRGRNDAALKAHATEAATAAALTAAQGLSSKLLDDHKRETIAAKAEAEQRVREASAALVQQVAEIATSVTELKGQVSDRGATIDKLVRVLASPGGAGQLAEIGLGNALRSFGLEEGRDYVLQQSTTDEASGRVFRPDAIVYLPSNATLIVDCKASKHLLAIAEHEGTAEEAQAYENLARTMTQHLRDLESKDYRNAVHAEMKRMGRDSEIGRVISVMYLPNEAALEKLYRADREFLQKARAANIIPAGPVGLYCALSLASAEINLMRQVENQQEIAERTRLLIEQIGIILNYARDVGRGIKTSADAYEKLSASVNNRLLGRLRGISQLGVQSTKQVPKPLPAFSVHSGEAAVIEGEAAEVESSPGSRLIAE